jgi:hypothetical protein
MESSSRWLAAAEKATARWTFSLPGSLWARLERRAAFVRRGRLASPDEVYISL